jgi:Trk K+ transport system NAD-binding subunit
MQHIIYLVLRRMRTPLIMLILAYAISVLGFVLIPGRNDGGELWRMDFFHAFYFVSFMGSTIGFGEIPYPFTDAQRLWTLFTIYATVISWLYAIGTLLTLLQAPLFQAAVTRNTFVRQVKKIKSSFYVVCGYGETGRRIVDALIRQNIDCVVIDKDINRINELELENLPREVPHLNSNAADSDALVWAGITGNYCKGVIAVTRDDEVNLKIAIASKLLNPALKVYCWAEHHDTVKNMASFGTDYIVNPYDLFAEFFSTALTSPQRYLLHKWLSSSYNSPLSEPVYPPKGRWLLCGFGRFGKAVYEKLLQHGLPVSVIELDLEGTGAPNGSLQGRGTEADTLEAAEIHKAVGIIAGTDHDVNNLSILVTARELNPGIFTIARQQLSANRQMFEAANLNLVTSNSVLIASSLLANITSPLTSQFLTSIKDKDEEWIGCVIDRLSPCVDNSNPYSWVVSINNTKTRAFMERFNQGENIYLHYLIREPSNRKAKLNCVALMIKRDGKEIILPDDKTLIYPHDRILFAGNILTKTKINSILTSRETLHYTATGNHLPASYFWRWITRRFGKHRA